MNAIRTARIGDLVRLRRNRVIIDPLETYREIGVRSFGKGIFHKQSIGGNTLGDKRVFEIRPGDLVLSNVFAWEGAIALAGDAEEGMIGSHRFMTYEVDSDDIILSWLRYFLLSESGLTMIRAASPGSAGRNRTLGVGAFENLRIPLPSTDDQRRGAQAIDRSLLSLIQLEHQLATSRRLVTAATVAAASRLDLAVAERAYLGWELTPLGVILKSADASFTPDSSEVYRAAGVFSFGRGMIDRGRLGGELITYKSMTRLSADDVIVSKLGGWEGGVTVVPSPFAGAIVSPELRTFKVDGSLATPSYMRAVTECPWFWDLIAKATKGSMARRKRVNEADFLKIEIWLPPLAIQERVGHQTDMLRGIRAQRAQVNGRLEALRPAILNRAFAGLV